MEEVNAPPPPSITSSPKSDKTDDIDVAMAISSPPKGSPKRDWNEVKKRDDKKTPSKLDLVRAKLAEATKGKDRLGRPLLFSKSPSKSFLFALHLFVVKYYFDKSKRRSNLIVFVAFRYRKRKASHTQWRRRRPQG